MATQHEIKGHHPHALAREGILNQEEHAKHLHAHHEKDALVIEVFPEEGVTMHELEKAVRAITIKDVTWVEKFSTEEVAFGVQKLVVGAIIKDASVETEAVQDAVNALHDSGKKLVKSTKFCCYNRICA